jgi:ubiquinone/menaquinone biosynthesis C-methylase UbiE
MTQELVYSTEPEDKQQYTDKLDREYSRFAGLYDVVVKVFPIWKSWITQVIPYIQGPKVLEASFGTGYLLMQYADRFDTYGIDYNAQMVATAKRNLERKGISATLEQGNVEALPYEDEMFDSIVNTMAFSGYPDGIKAMRELHRVLKTGGKLLMVDLACPPDNNWLGMKLLAFWMSLGDLVRDMDALFRKFNFDYMDKAIGGFGSVHLYIAEKK